jgi:peptide/nickel transport system substrate-binding protein
MSGFGTRVKMAVALAAASVLLVGVSACSSASDNTSHSNGSAERAAELKLQFVGSPISLNPALAGNGGSTVFASLAYDPLIFMASDGSLVPDLATSWKYTDTENKVFEVKLRSGVTFADGKPMDAAAVKASMEYFLKAGGGLATQVGKIGSIEAVDSSTVRINYSTSYPNAAASLSQYMMFGNIIGPDALANPKSLLTSMDGTGQYLYNASKSVPDSKYVYERNPKYWAPDAQLYNTVSVSIIGDPNAVLSAVSTGQVDVVGGSATTVDSAKSAGLKIVTAPFFNWALYLADMDGTITPALKNPKVRQAIGMAIDREAIAKGIGGGYGQANGQVMNKGTDGYLDGAGFTYDLSKAKSLLAEAGYPDGFSMTILAESSLDGKALRAQAIASSIEKLGITVTLKTIATGVPQFITEALSKKYAALVFPVTGTNMGDAYASLQSGMRNPLGYLDPKLEDLNTQSLVANSADRTKIYQKMTTQLTDDAMVIPVYSDDNMTYVGPKVTNVKATALNPNPMPTGPDAKYAWQPVK